MAIIYDINRITHKGLFAGGGLQQLVGAGSRTGMYKQAAAAPLLLEREGLAGDRQADRRFHGGPERALLLYPAEHYDFWRQQYPDRADIFVPGLLGENLCTRGITEQDVHVGDIFRLGKAVIQVSQPRSPCWKIARRTGLPKFARMAAKHGRAGWLYRVLEPGEVAPGDVPKLEQAADHDVNLTRMWAARNDRHPALDELAAIAALDGLAPAWRRDFSTRHKWLSERG